MRNAPILLLIVSLLGLTTGCGDVIAERVAFGDSVTFGYGGERGGWVSHLERDLGSPVANFGVPTERVSDGAARFVGPFGPLSLAQYASDILLLHGGNDLAGAFLGSKCKAKCAPEDLTAEIADITGRVAYIVDQAREHNRNVTVATYWRVNAEACSSGPLVLSAEEVGRANLLIDRYNFALSAMAADRRVALVRLDLLELEAETSNFYDCIHPSDQGYRKVALAWADAL